MEFAKGSETRSVVPPIHQNLLFCLVLNRLRSGGQLWRCCDHSDLLSLACPHPTPLAPSRSALSPNPPADLSLNPLQTSIRSKVEQVPCGLTLWRSE